MENRNERGELKKVYVVNCGGCSNEQSLNLTGKNEASTAARELGWSLTFDRGWLCQVCTHMNRRGK